MTVHHYLAQKWRTVQDCMRAGQHFLPTHSFTKWSRMAEACWWCLGGWGHSRGGWWRLDGLWKVKDGGMDIGGTKNDRIKQGLSHRSNRMKG